MKAKPSTFKPRKRPTSDLPRASGLALIATAAIHLHERRRPAARVHAVALRGANFPLLSEPIHV
jgi:hypothetical protein